MTQRTPRYLGALFAALAVAAAPADDPPRATVTSGRVDFVTQVEPILRSRCLSCHSRGKFKGGLSLETRDALLKGGESGAVVVAGKSADSLLVRMVAGQEPDRRMPQKGPALSPEEVAVLRAWVEQGLSWPEGRSFGFRQAPLAPRSPSVPSEANAALANPVDRFVAANLKARGASLDWAPVSDREFARRASLDLVGLLPSPDRVEKLEKDKAADKRARYVDELLSDRRNYAEHWLSFWNDALRNAYRGTGFIDGGRKTITTWLFRALYENKPYDRFVHELVSPVSGSEGFTKGIVWRGVVNASQAPPVQAAQNLSQVFLGTNLKCASCHDSFVNHWKLDQAYALASVFADKPLEVHRCDKPTGVTSTVAFIYPSLGEIDPSAPKAKRMDRLADLLVLRENGRLARTAVNRLWAQLMGRGLVEPLDDMDQPSWDQELLDWLATDLVEHKYDLKHTLARIATSRAYQLRSVGLAGPSESGPYRFEGPLTKRLTAEQFADALATVTGVWPRPTDDMVKVDGRGQGGQLAAVRQVLGIPKGGDSGPLRAALVFDDPLLTALGRTSREQVVTRRDSVATTLQALELINGTTLDETLRRGAVKLLEAGRDDPDGLVRRVYRTALGRPPTDEERAVCREMVGSPASVEGVQDVLWAVAMLPEFQLIR